jgi:hypothetical protein
MRESERARETGQRAARWVREHFRWEHSFARLDTVFRQLGVSIGSPARRAEESAS